MLTPPLLLPKTSRYGYLRTAVLAFIFDSSPGYMYMHLAKRVLEAEMPPSLRRTLAIATFSLSMRVTPLFYGDRPTLYWKEMKELHWGRPFLFLFSDDDPLCDAPKLKELIEEKRAMGQEVHAVCWAQSEHCGHLKLHREEYVGAMQEFLQQVSGGAGARMRSRL